MLLFLRRWFYEEKKHIFLSFFCCTLLLTTFIYSYERSGVNFISILFEPKLSNQLICTYTCDDNTLCSLTAGPGEVFYLLDYQNDIFLEGTFENKEYNINLLQSKKVYLSDTVLEEQTVICENLSFKLILDDFTWNFTKISETPSKSWIGSFANYVKDYTHEKKKSDFH